MRPATAFFHLSAAIYLGAVLWCLAVGAASVLMVGPGVLLYGFFALIVRAYARQSSTLTGLNIPNRWYWITPTHLPAAREMAVNDLSLVGAATMIALLGLPLGALQADATGRPPAWTELLWFGYLAFMMAFVIWTGRMRWRVP